MDEFCTNVLECGKSTNVNIYQQQPSQKYGATYNTMRTSKQHQNQNNSVPSNPYVKNYNYYKTPEATYSTKYDFNTTKSPKIRSISSRI